MTHLFVSGRGLKPERLTEVGPGGSKGVTFILCLRWLDRNLGEEKGNKEKQYFSKRVMTQK